MSLRLKGPSEDLKNRRYSDEGPRQGFQDINISNNTQTSKIDTTTNFQCNEFEDILKIIGSEGKLQKQILYYFFFPFIAILPFFILGMIFMLYEPNHWCHVPGKETNMDEDTWKNLTIPRESGTNEFSKCLMYIPNGNGSKIQCTHGWNYDRSDYRQTLPSEFNWVCTRGHYATGVFTAIAIGSCIGTPIYGWAGDKIGRKLVFYIICLVNLFFRGISLFIPEYFTAFLVVQFIAGTAFPMIYITPYTILTEICSNDFRSWLYGSTWMIWVIGICILPFISWLCADWFLIGVVTWVPGLMVFFYYKFLPESPRWLVSVGRLDEAELIIKNIARVNGTESEFKDGQISSMLKALYAKQLKREEKTPQVWDLFKRKRLAFYTILLGIVWSMNGLVYYGITLNSTAMGGNQFLNFFYLSLIELPAGWLGRVLVERTGRRWPQVVFFIICTIGFCMAAIGVSNNDNILVIIAVVMSKFSVALTSLVVNLQSNEIFPTQLRSSGNGLVGTFSALMQIGAPAIIYLRIYDVNAPYIAMGIISIIGVISCAYIPETLGQTLPDTIDDSNNIGKGIKFWSFLPKDYKISNNNSTHVGSDNPVYENENGIGNGNNRNS